VLRDQWRASYGPGDLPMPDDGAHVPGSSVDWKEVAASPHGLGKVVHEDDEDCLNDDGSWGPDDIPHDAGREGGSGVALGYSISDLDAVIVAERAVRLRSIRYDWEHWVRQFRYALAAWEMTRERLYARRLVEYGELAVSLQGCPAYGEVSYGHGYTPLNLSQLLDEAHNDPQRGLDKVNLRELAWIGYSRLCQMKAAPATPRDWAERFLELCAVAATPGTGQLTRDVRVGIDQSGDVQYSFHWGLIAHTALCAAHRLGRRPPRWVVVGMHAMERLPVVDYYGSPSMPAFCYSVNGLLIPATGPGQDSDPAHGWWSSNCAALAMMTGDKSWLARAARYGPQDKDSEQSRKESMLLRGARGW